MQIFCRKAYITDTQQLTVLCERGAQHATAGPGLDLPVLPRRQQRRAVVAPPSTQNRSLVGLCALLYSPIPTYQVELALRGKIFQNFHLKLISDFYSE